MQVDRTFLWVASLWRGNMRFRNHHRASHLHSLLSTSNCCWWKLSQESFESPGWKMNQAVPSDRRTIQRYVIPSSWPVRQMLEKTSWKSFFGWTKNFSRVDPEPELHSWSDAVGTHRIIRFVDIWIFCFYRRHRSDLHGAL